MTPADPNPAREADGRADREALCGCRSDVDPHKFRNDLAAEMHHAIFEHEGMTGHQCCCYEDAEQIEKWLQANRDAVLRALDAKPASQLQPLTQDVFDKVFEYKARAEAAEQSDREAHEALLHTSGRLKAAEAERDKWRNEWHPKALAYFDRAKKAEATIARVAALHYRRPHGRSSSGFPDFVAHGQTEFPDQCDHCQRNWPCETAAALKGPDA